MVYPLHSIPREMSIILILKHKDRFLPTYNGFVKLLQLASVGSIGKKNCVSDGGNKMIANICPMSAYAIFIGLKR